MELSDLIKDVRDVNVTIIKQNMAELHAMGFFPMRVPVPPEGIHDGNAFSYRRAVLLSEILNCLAIQAGYLDIE